MKVDTSIVPTRLRSVARRLRERRRDLALRRPLRELVEIAPADPPRELLADIFESWGTNWAANAELLAETVQRSREANKSILECGSGLTTFLAAVYANVPVWSLEHQPYWGRRVRRILDYHSVGGATVLDAELVDYDNFAWYSLQNIPDTQFDFVICDGPPSHSTKGGRYGLFPVMHHRLAKGAVILVDDYWRDHKHAVVARWEAEFDVTVEAVHEGSGSRSFAILRRQ